MKWIKVFESFSEIDSICKELGIENYTINGDGEVDVDGDVDIREDLLYYFGGYAAASDRAVNKLPIKFGKVSGNFNCNFTKLTTLEGAPREVGGDFICHTNRLTTLEGSPRVVGGDFDCHSNNITSTEGWPIKVGGNFNCSSNPIFQLYRLFTNYKSFIESQDYGYIRGNTIVKWRLEDALKDTGGKLSSLPLYYYKYI